MRGAVRVCGGSEVDVLVTDDGAPTAALEALRRAGVEVIAV
jgi:DeoR/GlpR family transcriptional regulator of sugar metabolism